MKMNDHDGLNALGITYLVVSLVGAAALILSSFSQWDAASSARSWNVDRDALRASATYNFAAGIAVGFSGFLVRGVLDWMVGVYRALAKLNGVQETASPEVPRVDSGLDEQ